MVTWWGVSSCTINQTVAQGFLHGSGMMFRIHSQTAVSIRPLSAFQHEDEYVLPPGTRLRVTEINITGNIAEVTLEETEEPALVQ